MLSDVVGLALVLVFLIGFVLLMFPVVMFLNKAIGASFERDGERLKESLVAPKFSEDGVRLRRSTLSVMSISRTWLYADLRADSNALYVMQYHRAPLFGRIGQPIISVVGRSNTGASTGIRATMTDHPRIEGDAVTVKCDLKLGGIWLRFKPQNPQALLEALHALYS